MSRIEIAAQHSMDEMATDLAYALHVITSEVSPAVLRLYTPQRLRRDLLAQMIRSMRDAERGHRIAA